MLHLGVIGMSAGNAHPSSWSAIINGSFDGEEISRLGFPAVADYLNANKDTLGLPAAKVTHVWAQSKELSEQIAKTAGIEHVVAEMTDMIGKVDAVLLLRDDPENHRKMAQPFIDAGVPIFIDKPLCSSTEDLEYFKSEISKGKFIMSCSSMRYAGECRSVKTEMKSYGELELITAVGKKDWIKYGVHMLEAIFYLVDDIAPISVINTGKEGKDIVVIEFENGLQAVIHLYMDVAPTFQISVFGKEKWKLVEIKNSYAMFRDNIIEFIRSLQAGKPRLEFRKTEQIIKVVIAGHQSLQQNGKKIYL